MLKLLHPLEKVGFIGLIFAVIWLLAAPAFPSTEYASLLVTLPVVLILIFGACLLIGQQRRIRANRAEMDRLLAMLDGDINVIMECGKQMEESAALLSRISEDSKKRATLQPGPQRGRPN